MNHAAIEALRRHREFLAAYRDAHARWIGGDAIPFPVGAENLYRTGGAPDPLVKLPGADGSSVATDGTP